MDPRTGKPLLVAAILGLLVVACDPTGPTASVASTVAEASATAPPSTSTQPDPNQTTLASQTDTPWGRIWDAVPTGFPRYPGATTADDATAEPVSAAYAIPDGDPAEVAAWMQTSLETAAYSTEGLSGPFEDGSFVLDSVGDADCRIETKVAPLGGLIMVTVLYGAACPAA